MWKDEVSSRETSSHDGIREGDGRLQLDQGDVVAAEDTGVALMFGFGAFHSRLCFIYRMKNGFQLSCTTMSAVPMKAAPSSVSTRLCLPMATLYSLPELLGERRKRRDVTFHPWCFPATWAVVSYLIQ